MFHNDVLKHITNAAYIHETKLSIESLAIDVYSSAADKIRIKMIECIGAADGVFDVDKFSAVGYADPPERGYQYYDVDGASRLARETVFLFQRQVHRTDPPRNNGLYKFNRTKKMYRFVSPVEEKLHFDPDHLNIDLPAEVEGDEEEEEGDEEGEEEEEEEE